jgi:hypothetical protein
MDLRLKNMHDAAGSSMGWAAACCETPCEEVEQRSVPDGTSFAFWIAWLERPRGEERGKRGW